MCLTCKCISAEKRQALLSKWNGRFMQIIDLLGCALMLILIALRLYNVFSGSNKKVFYIILTVYLLIFIGLLIAAEFKREKPRLYFDFLDNQFGRSIFISFIQLLILDESKAQHIILSIIVFAISLLGILLGHGLPPDGINSGKVPPPAENKRDPKKSAAPSSQGENVLGGINLNQMAANAIFGQINQAVDKFKQGGGEA